MDHFPWFKRAKKNWHFKREAIGFAAFLWKSGASLKCSIKTKGRTAIKMNRGLIFSKDKKWIKPTLHTSVKIAGIIEEIPHGRSSLAIGERHQ